jgi:hypothetical protein
MYGAYRCMGGPPLSKLTASLGNPGFSEMSQQAQNVIALI